ncbi:ferritin-like domain-containing protein [Amnibacterium sp.]|uniref:ferritin-like domain-containing protein n=1 Tax=Amnibacterium sp. TaxID=1872496 RepID=UPI003F7CA834
MAFDIDTFAETSSAVAWNDIDLDAFREHPLPETSLRALRYMCDVEYHTVCYLRDMLVTPSHGDGEVSTFMTMWNREEYWHGEALAAVLGVHGVTVEYDQLKASRVKLGWRDRIDPIKQSLFGNIIGKDFVATHMSWGSVNERGAAAAYRRLAKLEPHPALAPLLQRIAQQETRHIAFYTTQATKRLEESKLARMFTRFALSNVWGPVGSTIEPEEEVAFVMGYLFDGEDGLREVRKMDEAIAKMPGMSGLTVVENAFRARGLYADIRPA